MPAAVKPRRFPPPWMIEEFEESFVALDAGRLGGPSLTSNDHSLSIRVGLSGLRLRAVRWEPQELAVPQLMRGPGIFPRAFSTGWRRFRRRS